MHSVRPNFCHLQFGKLLSRFLWVVVWFRCQIRRSLNIFSFLLEWFPYESDEKRWEKKHVGQPSIFGDVYLPVYFALFSFIRLDVITVRCIFLIKLFMLEQALIDAVTFYFHTVEQLLQIPRNFLLVGELKHFFHNIHQSFSRLFLWRITLKL